MNIVEKLRDATGPDRLLDGLIMAATNPPRDLDGKPADIFIRYRSDYGQFKSFAGTPMSFSKPVPRYTEFVDDALLLQPKGYKWRIGCGKFVQYVAEAWAFPSDGRGIYIAECDANPAVALAWAFCMARAAGQSPQPEKLK